MSEPKETVFLCAAILHPTPAERERGERAMVVLEPRLVVAVNDASARLLASRLLSEAAAVSMDRVEMFVRPF